MEAEYYMFPIRNEQGFKVVNQATYAHMIHTIIEAATELAEEYPNKKILVVYESDSGLE